MNDQGLLFVQRRAGEVLLGFDVATPPPSPLQAPPRPAPFPVASRDGDPESSRKAKQTRSGKRRLGMVTARAVVYREPGLTYGEIASRAPHVFGEPQEALRRLSDLRKADEVASGPARVCRVRSSTCQTWWPPGHQAISGEE